MELFDVNLYAVLAGGVAAMIIGGLWYGPLMGKTWMDLTGFKPEDAPDNVAPLMIKSFISNLVLALGIGLIMEGETTIMSGVEIGFLVAVMIHGAAGISNYLFEAKPLKLFLVHMGNSVLAMIAMGALHGYFNASAFEKLTSLTN